MTHKKLEGLDKDLAKKYDRMDQWVRFEICNGNLEGLDADSEDLYEIRAWVDMVSKRIWSWHVSQNGYPVYDISENDLPEDIRGFDFRTKE